MLDLAKLANCLKIWLQTFPKIQFFNLSVAEGDARLLEKTSRHVRHIRLKSQCLYSISGGEMAELENLLVNKYL